MQWIMKICARGALGLGAAALLLSGVPAHANPASGAASRESQPRLLAQSKAQPGEAEKLEQQRLKEQQDRAKMQGTETTPEATDDEARCGERCPRRPRPGRRQAPSVWRRSYPPE